MNQLGISKIIKTKYINDLIHKDLINYYFTPGKIYYLINFLMKINLI